MSVMRERIDEILNKPMSRQQFLKNMGLLVLAVTGITGLINTFEGKNSSKVAGGSDSMAYGASAYSGGKKPV